MGNLKILSRDDLSEAICVIVGTRPGIIKMSPIILELRRRHLPSFTIHTGQHYSYEMDQKFFEDLELPAPRHHLQPCRQGSLHGEQTAQMLAGIEAALLLEKPKVALVCGDANTNLAGALAARKLQIAVGHVESGLRSHDWRMPEEHNRVIIDHISEYLFAPTSLSRKNLIKDNVRGRIYLTGNTVVDALSSHLELARAKSQITRELDLEGKDYLLMTMHREENVDSRPILEKIISALTLIDREIGLPLLFPIHPRTLNRLKGMQLLDSLKKLKNLRIINPLGYLDFLLLLSHARLVLTDSGGIQEEGCILHVPCVTLRDNTERPETLAVGANILGGIEPENILASVQQALQNRRQWPNPFGDGRAAERIVGVCLGEEINEWDDGHFEDQTRLAQGGN